MMAYGVRYTTGIKTVMAYGVRYIIGNNNNNKNDGIRCLTHLTLVIKTPNTLLAMLMCLRGSHVHAHVLQKNGKARISNRLNKSTCLAETLHLLRFPVHRHRTVIAEISFQAASPVCRILAVLLSGTQVTQPCIGSD